MNSDETFECRVERCKGSAIHLQLGSVQLHFSEAQFAALAGFLGQCAQKLALETTVQRSTINAIKPSKDGRVFQLVR